MTDGKFSLGSLFAEFEENPVSDPRATARKKSEDKKKKEEERQKVAAEAKQKAQETLKEKEPPEELERVVCYARDTRVFPAGTSLEEIKRTLAAEFFELSGDNVRMDWREEEFPEEGKKVLVVPIISYAKKGALSL